jgi:predicted kinase
MTELIMMIGLPRSGKSTQAKAISKSNGAPIVSSDAIRMAVHGHRWWAPGEPQVWATTKLCVKALFSAGHEKVILDSTNLTQKYRSEWENFADKISYVYVKTDPEICKIRARKADQADLLPVIDRFTGELELPEGYLLVLGDGAMPE